MEEEKQKEKIKTQESQIKSLELQLNSETLRQDLESSLESVEECKRTGNVKKREREDKGVKVEKRNMKVSVLCEEIESLEYIINLHTKTERELNSKVRYLERSKTKEDINYEYFKNVFLKYVSYSGAGAEKDAGQLLEVLFDLLHVNLQDKETVFTPKPPSSLWNYFTNTKNKNKDKNKNKNKNKHKHKTNPNNNTQTHNRTFTSNFNPELILKAESTY